MLLFLLSFFLFPVDVKAELNFEAKREICALTQAGQLTYQEAGRRLGLKTPNISGLRGIDGAVFKYCEYFKGR
tara:strand:- start:5911 stop:6129 length:219 start_codon:yes stop_codon:yes gene_type:complete